MLYKEKNYIFTITFWLCRDWEFRAMKTQAQFSMDYLACSILQIIKYWIIMRHFKQKTKYGRIYTAPKILECIKAIVLYNELFHYV
jgi:hypothetical protein